MPSASGAARASLTRRCCSSSESPSNEPDATVTWKWSPVPVRSSTPISAASGKRVLEQLPDALDGHRHDRIDASSSRPLALPTRADRPDDRRPRGRPRPRDGCTVLPGSSSAHACTRRRRRTCSGSPSSSSVASRRPRSRRPRSSRTRKLAVRKGAGNVVELGSIAAFGFSPLWLLAAAATSPEAPASTWTRSSPS